MSDIPALELNTFARLCKALKCDAVTFSRKFSEDSPLGTFLSNISVLQLDDELGQPLTRPLQVGTMVFAI